MSGISAQAPTVNVVQLRNERASGTGSGGSTSSSTWNTCPFNTEVIDTGGVCSLSSDRFTLAAGTYEFDAIVPVRQGVGSRLRIRNITDGSTVWITGFLYTTTSIDVAHQIVGKGRFPIAAGKALELQVYTTSGFSPNAFGSALSTGEAEIFNEIVLRKVA